MTPIVGVETENFLERAVAILTEAERADLVAYLAANPETGRLVPGTGGVRKIRWAISGKGKRGGARVIYYYRNKSIPLFVLDIYTKNEKSDLSEADKKAMRRIISQIVGQHNRR